MKMKKTYIAPVLEEHTIAMSKMLCVSGKLDDTEEITDPQNFGAPEFLDFEAITNN